MSQNVHKKIFTEQEISALPEKQLILIIHGGVYDITEFTDLHPGGREPLLKYNRKDASKAFAAIKHSLTAQKSLQDYCIGILENHEAIHQTFVENLSNADNKSSLLNNLKKLFSHEDKFHIHKTLGALVLGHFAVRISILLIGTLVFLVNGDSSIFMLNPRMDPAWLLLLMTFIHGALSLSSLQFSVPAKASQSKPMIHALFRAHSINFAMRAVFCMFFAVVLLDNPTMRYLAISIVIFFTFIIADIITRKLTAEGDRFDTTASMPYWFGVSPKRQRIHKFLYGYAQFLATFVCLTAGYAGALYTLAPIQGAAFGMTLVRKNILSPKINHNIYLLLLFLPIPFVFFIYPLRVAGGVLFTLFLFYLRTLGVNKYLLWTPLLIAYNILLVPAEYHKPFILGIFFLSLLAVIINLVYLKFFSAQSRIDKNNRLIARKQLTEDAYELIIRTKLPMSFLPGQHVLIKFHDGLERKYSPVWAQYENRTDQTRLSLRIKKYAPANGINASTFLATCPINTILDLHGPIGAKYYSSEEKSINDDFNGKQYPLEDYDVFLFSAGSGITPIYQLTKHICADSGKINLITCDKNPSSQMMAAEISDLEEQFPEYIKHYQIFSESFKNNQDNTNQANIFNQRLDKILLAKLFSENSGKPKLIIICGPNAWQNLIQDFLGSQQSFKYELIIW